MTYIYDILLNFNDDFYEFYEWEKGDNIYHIKKVPIIKVESEFIENILSKEIEISKDLLNLIMNKTEVFEGKRIKYLKYCCLFTDGYKVIGVNIVENSIKLSDMLLDESVDALDIAKRCDFLDIAYNIVGDKNINYFDTRREIKIKNNLISEINSIYKDKNYDKLKYLYFEYFNKNIDDIDTIYNDLINSMDKINNKHYKLYELLKLCNKKTRNLTK